MDMLTSELGYEYHIEGPANHFIGLRYHGKDYSVYGYEWFVNFISERTRDNYRR